MPPTPSGEMEGTTLDECQMMLVRPVPITHRNYLSNGDRPARSRAEAVECLAYELNWKQEQLDPDPDGDWYTYSERDKQFFRHCIEWLLAHPKLLRSALRF